MMTIRNGDNAEPSERFKDLYQRFYWRMVRFYVRAFRVSQEDAEELTQEAFLRFYEALDEYRGDAEWGFLETIARNVAYNWIRSRMTAKRNAPTVSIDDRETFRKNEPEAKPHDYAEGEEVKRLYAAIASLPASQRICVEYQLQGYKYEEMAAVLRITVDAVKSRLRDARKTLRARLGSADALPEDDE